VDNGANLLLGLSPANCLQLAGGLDPGDPIAQILIGHEMRLRGPSCPHCAYTASSSPILTSAAGRHLSTSHAIQRMVQGCEMKAPRFSYARPERLDEVFALLAQHGDDARILAGGQSLIPTLNMRLSQPKLLIDINRLEALKGISLEAGVIRVGALARHVE